MIKFVLLHILHRKLFEACEKTLLAYVVTCFDPYLKKHKKQSWIKFVAQN
jgi:hypothetical protein